MNTSNLTRSLTITLGLLACAPTFGCYQPDEHHDPDMDMDMDMDSEDEDVDSEGEADTGDEPGADTGDEPDGDTGDEPDGDTSDEPDGDTGDGPDDEPEEEDPEDPCLEANAPSLLVLDGRAFPREAVQAQWGAPIAGCSAAAEYEVAIGTEAGGDDLMAFTSVGDSLEYDGALPDGVILPASVELFLSVRSIDAKGNISDSVAKSFSIWTPAELPGLAVWIDFADPSTVFADASCSRAAQDGDSVDCVLDKSGNDNHFTTVSGHAGPVWYEVGLGEQPAADFEGDCLLRADSSPSVSAASPALTLALVDAPTTIVAADVSELRYPVQKEDEFEFGYFAERFNVAIDTTASGSWGWNAVTATTEPREQLNIFTHDDDVWRFRRDGNDLGYVAPGNAQTGPINSVATPVYLGGRINAANSSVAYDARQGEVILLSATLSAEDMADLERYLMEKWSL